MSSKSDMESDSTWYWQTNTVAATIRHSDIDNGNMSGTISVSDYNCECVSDNGTEYDFHSESDSDSDNSGIH